MQALQSERVGLAKDGFARINLPGYSPNLGQREAMLAEHGSGEAMLAELGSGEAMQAELSLSLGSLPAPSLRREGGEAGFVELAELGSLERQLGSLRRGLTLGSRR